MKLKLRNWYNKIVKNRFRSKNGRSIGDPQNCSLLEALAENDQLKAELADERIMYKSLSSMHHAAKQDWWDERESLKSENDRLRAKLERVEGLRERWFQVASDNPEEEEYRVFACNLDAALKEEGKGWLSL